MRSVELFTGAGGLALGLSAAGFDHELVAEWDRDACDTIRQNQLRGIEPVAHWPLVEGDVRCLRYSELVRRDIDLVAGGPPCQPFSLGGKHRGPQDQRDMFPEAVRAVRELQPRAFIFENVRGLLRQSFADYFEYILLQLSYPEIAREAKEGWAEHRARLERHHTVGIGDGLRYNVVFQAVNAADYGVPQRRERVLIVGFRGDLRLMWSFPRPTHSFDALLHTQWVTGEYWERHRLSGKHRPEIPAQHAQRIRGLRSRLFPVEGQPWTTVRDAISDLPDPESLEATHVLNHRFQPGARPYMGHTGSPIDEPAKTIKAGDHGVPGGENTVLYPDGRFRYFTVRETARLQGFPNDYLFQGSWTESMRQLGNAVPVPLARLVGKTIKARLDEATVEADE